MRGRRSACCGAARRRRRLWRAPPPPQWLQRRHRDRWVARATVVGYPGADMAADRHGLEAGGINFYSPCCKLRAGGPVRDGAPTWLFPSTTHSGLSHCGAPADEAVLLNARTEPSSLVTESGIYSRWAPIAGTRRNSTTLRSATSSSDSWSPSPRTARSLNLCSR